MLTKFQISNFRSIQEMVVDLSFGEGKAPNGYKNSEILYFHEVKKQRLVPCLALYGANASGKTNILKAFSTMRRVIMKGVSDDVFDPNRLNNSSNFTKFHIFFITKAYKYSYEIEYNNEEIINENLYCDNIALFSISPKNKNFDNLSTKTYPPKTLFDFLDVECSENKIQKKTFISIIGKRYPGLNKKLLEAFNYIKNSIIIRLDNEIPLSMSIDMLSEALLSKENPQIAFDEITNLLKKLDINISRMELDRKTHEIDEENQLDFLKIAQQIHKIEFKKNKLLISADNITSYHKDINGNEVAFNFNKAESRGTIVASGLLGTILSALKQGKILVIDELDRSLHPLLLIKIIQLFKDKRYNQTNAQLIFTIHDVIPLESDILRPSEIGIITKTLKKGSTIKRLCEENDLRNANNFKKLYLQGAFSGIPYPYI